MKRWILAAAGLLLAGSDSDLSGAAGTVQLAGKSYSIDVWGTEDGLPGSAVIAMTQTRDGYLWLGTLYGLVRFDGIRFEVFDESTTPGLSSSPIVHLFEDRQGNLWIGTETAGIAVAKDGQATSLGIGRGSREGRLVAACEDSIGAVWLYTANGQLWRFHNGHTNAFLVGAEPFSFCRTMISEPGGPLWVGMDSRQLAINPPLAGNASELPTEQSLPALQLDFLLASPNGGYWRLADGQIQKWKTNRVERDLGPYRWSPWRNMVTAACEDRQGNLVVGTHGEGVFWFDTEGKFVRLTGGKILTHDTILSLCVDREGSLWVGTDGGGLNRVKRQVFETLEASLGTTIRTVCEDRQGGLWFGTFGDDLKYWKDGTLQKFGRAQGLSDLNVRAVLVDSNQTVWVGTSVGGLFQFQNGLFRQVELAAREVSTLHQDRAGRFWLGTRRGLARMDPPQWKVFTTRDGLSSDMVRALADDAEGNLWIGTVGGGLNRLRDGQFTTFRKADGLPSDDISSLWVDVEGVLWIGTAGSGLARFHKGKWTHYTTREGLASNGVGYLIDDGQGSLWIGSNAGLMRAPKQALNDFAQDPTNSIACRTYSKPDGLPTRECTSGSQPGPWRARDGQLWFPTTKGLVSVNPTQLTPNPHEPPVVIELVLIDDQPQNSTGIRARPISAVTMLPRQERLEIRYTSLNLAAPDRARFRFRLEGNETAWTEAGGIRVAHYGKLSPGRYRFQVTACNEDGVWNPAGSTLAITVEPPFWWTWWFLSAMTVFFLGTIIAVVHYFSTQKLQRQLERLRQQEALEKERARIARDIHDQLGASLTQVALLGELVESDKNSPDQVEAHARQISQTARDTTRGLDEIVWTVNPSNDSLDGLITYVCKYAQEYLAVASVRYRLAVPPQLPSRAISPEVRHNVFLAAKEALTNVVRHAQASAVWVRLKLEPAAFILEIEDNGRGLGGLAEKAGRNGLRNMRKRMEDVSGSFTIGPAAEGGTLVRLTAPFVNR